MNAMKEERKVCKRGRASKQRREGTNNKEIMQVMIINRKISNEKTEKHETMQVLIGIWPVVRPYFLIAGELFLAVLNVGDQRRRQCDPRRSLQQDRNGTPERRPTKRWYAGSACALRER